MDKLSNDFASFKPKKGTVYIAGSGPGDPSLLTIGCYRLIKQCDVVVYDRLVCNDIINLIPKSSEKIFAGKSCNQHFMTQDEINAELCSKALQNKSVLRLKGGDPLIFGRGSEEAAYLMQRNVAFEYLAGVSAATGCSTYCGIALTHRGICNGVSFITGHKQNDTPIEHDWQALVRSKNTLVVYMGVKNANSIAQNLINNGMDRKTNIAIIENGTTKHQRVFFTNVNNLYQDIKINNVKAPALIIIGDVVAQSQL